MRTNFLATIFGLSMIAAGLCACSDGGTSSSTGGTTSSTGGTTSSGGSGGTGGTSSSGGTTASGGTAGTGGSTGGSVAYGTCAKPCGTVADCCTPGAIDCPSNMYPNNWQCDLGACRSPQCGSTADCSTVDPSLDCFVLGGFHACVKPCTIDGDCNAPTTCSGVDDGGNKYCTTTGGGCTDDASCNGFGKCVDKLCVCSADADCTFMGFTKCAL